jgi:hypothetical protein
LCESLPDPSGCWRLAPAAPFGVRCSMGYKIIKRKKVDLGLFSSDLARRAPAQRVAKGLKV